MFENLLKPNPVLVGQRIAKIKDELGVSFTELGNRLGVPKPTISSYVYGKSLAPEKVITKLSKMSGKKIGWFYYGEIEDYISEYLNLTGYGAMIADFPDIIIRVKNDFLFGSNKNSMWENEIGYPVEEFLDDCFAEYRHEIKKNYVYSITKDFIENKTDLKGDQKEEAITLISSSTNYYINEIGDLEYGDKEAIEKLVEDYYNHNIKGTVISFDDHYLVGKLINVLNDDDATVELIDQLSSTLTGNHFTGFFGGAELLNIFKSIRPELIKLYAEKSNDDFYDWFEK